MSRKNTELNAQILDEAVSWFIEFHEGEVSPEDRADFNAWLRRSPEHVRAYLQTSAFWEDAEALKKLDVDLDSLVSSARAEANIFPLALRRGLATRAVENLASAVGAECDRPGLNTRAAPVRFALAASLLLTVAAGFFGWQLYDNRNTYATEIGEQRSISLEDGSTVELNAMSRVKVSYTPEQRTIELLEGQALFKVAKNHARPFVVRSGEAIVRAVGTQFDVYRKSTGTVVTVVEGRVAVKAPNAASRQTAPTEDGVQHSGVPRALVDKDAVLLVAGEQLIVTADAVSRPVHANLSAATGWTDDKLVFDSTPLREVVEEFNRYNRQQLVILDPELYDYHISGEFPSTDSSRMVEFLRQRFGVTLTSNGNRVEISRPRAAPPTALDTAT